MPWYPKVIAGVVAVLTLGLTLVRPLRRWALQVPMQRLIALHLIRFVGFYFLYLYGRHELPYRFAVWGGTGDIVVAALAVPLVDIVAGGRGAGDHCDSCVDAGAPRRHIEQP